MSKALVSAARLKADIRLAQAVSLFEASLSPEQKDSLRQTRSNTHEFMPTPHDVMRLTAEIDRNGGKCIGPRLTNFLESVQRFAALGDVVVGGSQQIIACSIWALVRLALLVRYTLRQTDVV